MSPVPGTENSASTNQQRRHREYCSLQCHVEWRARIPYQLPHYVIALDEIRAKGKTNDTLVQHDRMATLEIARSHGLHGTLSTTGSGGPCRSDTWLAPPNGLRLSGERSRATRVRCSRGLGVRHIEVSLSTGGPTDDK